MSGNLLLPLAYSSGEPGKEVRIGRRVGELWASQFGIAALPTGASQPVEGIVNDLALSRSRTRSNRESRVLTPARTEQLPSPRAGLDVVECGVHSRRRAALEVRKAAAEDEIAELQDIEQRWNDPAFIRNQARERFGWVMPGEVGYRVIGLDGEVKASMGSVSPKRLTMVLGVAPGNVIR